MRFGRFGPWSVSVLLAAGAGGCASSPVAAHAPTGAVWSSLGSAATDAGHRAAAASEPPWAAVHWAYRAGAPLAAPAGIGPDGSVVVGSVDGYLHALREDGSFRWGYTLRGPLVGRPLVGGDGAVFAAADPNGLYALAGDGTLDWVSSVSGGVRSPPVLDAASHVWVATGQGTLLGFSQHGGIVGFARLGAARPLGLAPLPKGGVAVASVDGSVRIAGRPGAGERSVSSGPLLDLEVGSDGLFVLGAAGLSRLDALAGEERWFRTSVVRVACSRPALVVVEGHGLRWLSAEGEPRAVVPFAVGAQRAIACFEDGSLVVPDDAGALARVDARGVRGRVRLPPGRLVSLDPAKSGLLIAGYRDGRVLAVEPPR